MINGEKVNTAEEAFKAFIASDDSNPLLSAAKSAFYAGFLAGYDHASATATKAMGEVVAKAARAIE